jgi:hypothetical protein
MGGLCSLCNPSGGSDFAPPQMQRNTIFTMKNAAYKAFKYDVFKSV